MADGLDVRNAWIERVLGIKVVAPTSAAAPAASGSASVAFNKVRLAWDSTRKQVHGELQKLEAAILEQCRDEPDYNLIAGNTRRLYGAVDFMDNRLIDKLDEGLNAASPMARLDRQNEAREIIDEYLDYVRSDELLNDVDDNGFVDLSLISMLTTQLNDMSRLLAA